jgi:hypothetical protein
MYLLIATTGPLLRTFPMTHRLSIRIAVMCLRSRSTLPLLAVGRWVLLAKEMFGAIEQAVRQRIVRATCVRIGEQH